MTERHPPRWVGRTAAPAAAALLAGSVAYGATEESFQLTAASQPLQGDEADQQARQLRRQIAAQERRLDAVRDRIQDVRRQTRQARGATRALGAQPGPGSTVTAESLPAPVTQPAQNSQQSAPSTHTTSGASG